MLHELLTGARPFAGESSAQLMSSILRDVPLSISDARTDVPEALARLIGRCLEKRPDDRIQTARDVYNELRHVQRRLDTKDQRPVRTSGDDTTQRSSEVWIAVLPFAARSNDDETRTLAEGLTDDVTSGLAKFPWLSVVSQSALPFAQCPTPLDYR